MRPQGAEEAHRELLRSIDRIRASRRRGLDSELFSIWACALRNGVLVSAFAARRGPCEICVPAYCRTGELSLELSLVRACFEGRIT